MLGLILVGLLLCGCATPKGKPFQLIQPVPQGKGVLYVYGGPGEVMINDNAVGNLNGPDYLAFLCKPGPLTVSTGWKTEINNAPVNITSGSQNFVNVKSRFTFWRQLFTLGIASKKFDIKPKLVAETDALKQIKDRRIAAPSHGLTEELSGKVTAGVDFTKFKKIYVDVGKKSRNTAPFIVSGLKARGYTVSSGTAAAMPADTDCLVKLDEFWFWDLGMYLLKLKVEFINPKTKAVYATAKVERAWPQGRRGPKIMSTEALNAIFNNGMPAGVKGIL